MTMSCEMFPELEEMARCLSFTDQDLRLFGVQSPREFHELSVRFKKTHAHLVECPLCRKAAIRLVAFYEQTAQA